MPSTPAFACARGSARHARCGWAGGIALGLVVAGTALTAPPAMAATPTFDPVIAESVRQATEAGGLTVTCVDVDRYVSRYAYAPEFTRTLYTLSASSGGPSSVILSDANGAYRAIPGVDGSGTDAAFLRASLRAIGKPAARFVRADKEPGPEFGVDGARWLFNDDQSARLKPISATSWQTVRNQWGHQLSVTVAQGRIVRSQTVGPEPETCTYSYGRTTVPTVGSQVLSPDQAYGNAGFAPVTRGAASGWLVDVRDGVVRGVRVAPKSASNKALAASVARAAADDLAGKWDVQVTNNRGTYRVLLNHRTTGETVTVQADQTRFRSGSITRVRATLDVGGQRVTV